ncbi:MAG: response regulator [Deltaproteobacteria bacterium]|nr:response regulator [Deltaproteobacteria bacterium]
MLVLVTLAISSYFVVRNQRDLDEANSNKYAMMRHELAKKGSVLARNVAIASERAVAVLDFLFLAEVISSATQHDSEIVYGIILDKEGKALVHSDARQSGKKLDDPATRRAIESADGSELEISYSGRPTLDVSAPIVVAGKPWGAIRFGLSLDGVNAEISKNKAQAEEKLRSGLIVAGSAAALLLMFAAFIATIASAQIVGPVDALISGVNRLRTGDLSTQVGVSGIPEFIGLAQAFNDMANAIKERDEALTQNNRQLEKALATANEVNRLKSEFLANISHELRTPLNAIVNVPKILLAEYSNVPVWTCPRCHAEFEGEFSAVGSDEPEHCPDDGAEMLLGKRTISTGVPEEQRHFLSRLLHQGQHMLNVVNELLDFSKLDAGKMELHIEQVDIGRVFADVEQTMQGLAAEKRLTVHFPDLADVRLVRADPVKLAQILINLIGNAIKFTPPNGRIVIQLTKRQVNGVVADEIRVTDSGIGIPKEHLEAIFESFRQVDSGHTRKAGGTGLGLTITRHLVELHGGRIWVDSEPNQGSTFTFYLPVEGNTSVGDSAAQPAAVGAAELIVVVDDNEVQLEVMRVVLERAKYRVDLVSNPLDAFDTVTRHRPDWIVLDVMMPQVSGVALLKQLKADERTRDIPVFVATAYHDNEQQVRSLGALWLPKPWTADDFQRVVNEYRVGAKS